MPNLLQPVLNVLRPILPARFRPDIPVVPVVRLSGVIGVVTPLRPGLMLSTIARSLERAFSVRNARAVALVINSPGGSPLSVAPDLFTAPLAGGGKEAAGARLHRGCGGVRRLHDRLCGGRDLRRSVLRRRLDRRRLRRVRLSI